MKVATQANPRDVEGVWTEFQEGVKFRIARAGNPKYLSTIDRLEAPHRKKMARGKLSTAKQLDIQCQAMGEALLVDWSGVETEDGPLEYTPENAAAVLRYNSDIREFVFEFAIDQENFRAESIKETAKKSKT